MEAKLVTARAAAMVADSPKSLNIGNTTGKNSVGSSARAMAASTVPDTTVKRSRALLRDIISSSLCPSPMALPTSTAVAAPRPKQNTKNSRPRFPITALAASISTEFSV